MFSDLIVKRKWEKVTKKVKSDITLGMPHRSQLCTRCRQLHSPLFFACVYSPPVGTIKALLRANPWAIFEVDCEQRLPLHIACENGASPKVINELIIAYPEAVSKKDGQGMFPLHKVCQSYYGNVDILVSKEDTLKYLSKVIKVLLKTDPSTILVRDSIGMSPIEYALSARMYTVCLNILLKAESALQSKALQR